MTSSNDASVRNGSQLERPANRVIEQYSALVDHVQNEAFPALREGIMTPIDKSTWPKWRKIFYDISLPSVWVTARFNLILFGLWQLFSLTLLTVYDALLKQFIGGVNITSGTVTDNLLINRILSIIVLIILSVFIFANYWSWVEILLDKRMKLFWRILLFLGFLAVILTIPYWAVEPQYRGEFLPLLFGGSYKGNLLLFLYIAFLVPAFSFFYRMSFTEILIPFGWFIYVFHRYFSTFHYPIPKHLIQKILAEPISIGTTEERFSISALPLTKIQLFRELAVTNRESTDKRLLPTAIFFGFLGLVANIDSVQQFIGNLFAWLLSLFTQETGQSTWEAFGKLWLIILIALVVLYFLKIMLPLFMNLLTQSIIIETCIVIEYEQNRVNQPTPSGWRNLLIRFLSK